MRRWLLTLLTAAAFSASVSAAGDAPPDRESGFRRGNDAYRLGEYDRAIALYREVLDEGWAGAALYYNLGNAFFKTGNLGRAVLNYRKAWNLSPGDPEIGKNLEYAREELREDTSGLKAGFWSRARRSVALLLPPSHWILAACALYWLAALLAVAAFFLPGFRGAAGTALKVLAGVFVLCVVGAWLAWGYYHVPRAVVLASRVEVLYSPEAEATPAFVLHEGSEVRVIRGEGRWRQIALPDGKSGWVPAEALGSI